LAKLAGQHDFLLFEDRKFADIGNTVAMQYGAGVYRIAEWAHITNAHGVPGEGIIQGLATVGMPLGRGCLMLAEMSSAGNLAHGEYTAATVAMARKHGDFVIGFIGQSRLVPDAPELVVMSPGVGLHTKADPLGQQYRTPGEVIIQSDSDVIIVGRGIYGDADPEARAVEYRDAGWSAYLRKIGASA
jgi:orotidine-5'-phosphate decarboxylase